MFLWVITIYRRKVELTSGTKLHKKVALPSFPAPFKNFAFAGFFFGLLNLFSLSALFHVLVIQVFQFKTYKSLKFVIQVTSLVAQVRKMKVRVGRLKAQNEAVKPRVEY